MLMATMVGSIPASTPILKYDRYEDTTKRTRGQVLSRWSYIYSLVSALSHEYSIPDSSSLPELHLSPS